MYAKSSKSYTMEFILVRESVSYFVHIFSILLIMLIYYWFESFIGLFVVASVVGLLNLFIPKLFRDYISSLRHYQS